MKIITGGPLVGKTTKLIEIAARDNLYIVCHGQREARRIAEMADKMDLDILFPITYDEFINWKSMLGSRIKGFVIDNAGMLLGYMARSVPVVAISFRTDRSFLNVEEAL